MVISVLPCPRARPEGLVTGDPQLHRTTAIAAKGCEARGRDRIITTVLEQYRAAQ